MCIRDRFYSLLAESTLLFNKAPYKNVIVMGHVQDENGQKKMCIRDSSMTGVLFILYFGSKNVLGNGWKTWDVAAFTTFLSCFLKLAVKSSHAAKLFNAVHKAQVSWKRIKPLMKETTYEDDSLVQEPVSYTHLRARM